MLPRKITFKLFLALAIPLFLAWAVSSISEGNNLYFFKLAGFVILIAFGLYASFVLFTRFGRSMKLASRERNPMKKTLFFSVFFLLLIAIIIGIDKFFETAFKFGGLGN